MNAPLSPWLIKKLDIVKLNYSQVNLYDQIIIQLEDYTNKMIEKKLKKSKFLKSANWSEVKRQVFNKKYDRAKNKYNKPDMDNKILKKIESEELVEARFRCLKITKSLYWKYFLNGFCTGLVTIQLMESADISLDNLNQPLNDWDYVHKQILNGFMDRVFFKVNKCFFV